MRTFLFLLLIAPFPAIAQEKTPNHFIELHYTGSAYSSVYGHARPYNSGFGATLNRTLGRHTSIELFYDNFWAKEEPQYPSPGHTEYKTVAQTIGIRVAVGKVAENWSLKGIAGFGVRFSSATSYRGALDLGARFTRNITPHLALHATSYVQLTRVQEPEFSHWGDSSYGTWFSPLSTRGMLFVNLGLAYHFAAF